MDTARLELWETILDVMSFSVPCQLYLLANLVTSCQLLVNKKFIAIL